MASEARTTVLKQVEALLRSGSTTGLSDGHLLERFADQRRADSSQAAFAALVDRHGAMVLRTCQQVLGDEHAAQDAAQATFLVLARRARSVAEVDSVGGWLHGVAVRVAAKARVAEARRRARERRAGETRSGEAPDPDRWLELHEELGRLPESFRAPLILCYLEGLTQEQAAAQLRWPLGTVQSRLARGREKLKRKLAARGVAPAAGLLAGSAAAPSQAAPAGWAEATVRAAILFHKGSGAIQAGACPASAGLALEVLRTMTLHKLKLALGALLTVAVAVSGAAVLQRQDKDKPAAKAAKADPPAVAKTTPPIRPTPPLQADRTVRGVVRDADGKPLAKVWVGNDPRPAQDDWDNPRPEDIRECKEPFRDARGEVIPPGAVGKYFEVRENGGAWKAVSPDDIRPWEAIVWNGDGHAVPKEEVAKTHSAYTVRVAKGGWWMAGMPGVQNPVRTDPEGRFETKFALNGMGQAKLHFASTDYTLQATHLVKADDLADKPLDITLKPTRLVRARVIEVPKDDPKMYMNWGAYIAEEPGKPWREWQSWMLPNPNANNPAHVKRQLEVRLPAGKYKFEFRSQTLHRVVDIEVPPGIGPLDLPDLRLESLASVRNIGKPAMEITANDLEGKAVRLADFRGKVVVLDFWATWCSPCVGAMPRLMELQTRFKDKPLVFLALHDASIAGADGYKKAVEPVKPYWGGADLPFHVLLDQAVAGKGTRPYDYKPGEKGSGHSADTYDVMSWPSTFVIAPDGTLVGKFEIDALEGALEDQFGMPRSRPVGTPAAGRAEPPQPRRNVKIKGKIVGPDGKPVAGATLSPQQVVVRQKDIKTGPAGDFEFNAEQILIDHFYLRVEAPALASKMFRIEADSELRLPLKLGIGATVTGRVLRNGKPVAGVPMSIHQLARGMDNYLGSLTAKTDAEGRFRIEHAYTEQEFRAYTATASLADHGAINPVTVKTGGDGTSVDLGDLKVLPGLKIAGRVVFSDGKAVPPGTLAMATPENIGGLARAKVDDSGRFEILGLPECEIVVLVQFPKIQTWMPAGYRLSARNKCRSPLNNYCLTGRLDRDVADLIILIEPGSEPRSNYEPGALADFNEAKSGLITGAPPEAFPPK
jgi:RNA polymerase sigma factor (sigma-70 family)